MDQQFLEAIGYAASVITAVSLMMKNIRRLRWLNFAGATVFSIYGGLIGAWPVAFMNGLIAFIDIYYLAQMNRQKEHFDIMDANPFRSDYALRFLEFYKEDIAEFFPDFSLDKNKSYHAVFCLRDARPVSLTILTPQTDRKYEVVLDYAIPEYRDKKNGRYFYYEGLKKLGLDRGNVFMTVTKHKSHEDYLRSLGFRKIGDSDKGKIYRLDLTA